jgi:hypothetical protein
MKLTKRVALLFIPGEYIKTWPPTGPNNTLNNFSRTIRNYASPVSLGKLGWAAGLYLPARPPRH